MYTDRRGKCISTRWEWEFLCVSLYWVLYQQYSFSKTSVRATRTRHPVTSDNFHMFPLTGSRTGSSKLQFLPLHAVHRIARSGTSTLVSTQRKYENASRKTPTRNAWIISLSTWRRQQHMSRADWDLDPPLWNVKNHISDWESFSGSKLYWTERRKSPHALEEAQVYPKFSELTWSPTWTDA